MRNLKKVLSLVLALAMVLSICMVGAGAANYDDFTDEESIIKKQAVETLVSLDVINGYNDGAEFRPTGNVTRAEMATMICRILAGGDKAIPDATKEIPTYNDIRNNPSAAWAETYIEYCTSLGIVSGKGNGIFDPMADVTAAEAAKMAMTALGYNADIEGFKGIGWDINTMAKASTLNLTENLVGEISANTPMTRQQVAQLLYNALTAYMVQGYNGNMANTWVGSGANAYHETLLESKFNVEKVTGVIEANEFADLHDTTPIREGTTRLNLMDENHNITGRTRVVNVGTTLDQIGHSVIVYCDKTTNRVVYGNTQDTEMNDFQEFTTELSSLTRGNDAPYSAAELKNAEYYINFGDSISTTGEIDRYFEVTLTEVNVDAQNNPVVANTATGELSLTDTTRKVIYRVGQKLTAQEYSDLKTNIITRITHENTTAAGDSFIYTQGDVIWMSKTGVTDPVPYVASAFTGRVTSNESFNTGVNKVEYSNWEGFSDYYLTNINTYNSEVISSNENGNYLKCVDANNDGEVDYVLKTVYTASTVQRVNRNGELTLTDYASAVKDPYNQIILEDNRTTGAVKTLQKVEQGEPADGDVVLYTVIDGTAYFYVADMVTGKIDRVHMNNVTVTTTDGETYNQSGVNMIFRQEVMDDLVGVTDESEDARAHITTMKGDRSYDMYFDLYGNIVSWRSTVTTGSFLLLTDGWFRVAKDGNEYAVKAYNDEEGKIQVYDVDGRTGSLFIKDKTSGNSDNNDWGQLKEFTKWKTNEHVTTVASYSANSEGVLTLAAVGSEFNNRNVDVIDLTVVDLKGNSDYLTGTAAQGENVGTNALKTYNGNATYKTGSAMINRDGDGDNTNDYLNVRVRPRSDTVYYYVINDGRDVKVERYVGYANAPSVTKDKINSIYAVGTEYGNYYVANVIVVELNSSYKDASDILFIYDGPEMIDGVGTGVFSVITSDGEAKDVNVKYDARDPGTGLFDRSRFEEGDWEGFYKAEKISDNEYNVNLGSGRVLSTEYAKYGILVGYVGQYANGVVPADYCYAWPVFSTDPLSAWTRNTTVDDALPGRGNYRNNNANEVRSLLTNGKFYTLDYTTIRSNGQEKANLSDSNSNTVTADAVYRSTNTRTEVNNKIILFYNASRKDQGAVYAISVALNGDSLSDSRYNHTAELMWERLWHMDATRDTTIKFFGVEDGKTGDNSTPGGATTLDRTIEVTYQQAKNWSGAKLTYPDTAENVVLTSSDGSVIKPNDIVLNPSMDGTTKSTYYLYLDDVKYTLVQQAASNNTDLFEDWDNDGTWTQIVNRESDYTNSGTLITHVENFEKLFHVYTATNTGREGIEFTYFDENNNELPHTNTALAAVAYAQVTVTAENGRTRTYLIGVNSNPDDILPTFAALKGTLESGIKLDIYLNGDTFFATSGAAYGDNAGTAPNNWVVASSTPGNMSRVDELTAVMNALNVWLDTYNNGEYKDAFSVTADSMNPAGNLTNVTYGTTSGAPGHDGYQEENRAAIQVRDANGNFLDTRTLEVTWVLHTCVPVERGARTAATALSSELFTVYVKNTDAETTPSNTNTIYYASRAELEADAAGTAGRNLYTVLAELANAKLTAPYLLVDAENGNFDAASFDPHGRGGTDEAARTITACASGGPTGAEWQFQVDMAWDENGTPRYLAMGSDPATKFADDPIIYWAVESVTPAP